IAQTGWRNCNGDRVGGHASEHSRTVKCESAHTDECRRVGKQVDGEKIGAARLRIIPHRKFWVVTQLRRVGRVNLNGIEKPPATDRTGRLRDSNALPEGDPGKGGKSEVAHHPAISHLIVEDEWITVVKTAARRARQRRKERVV